ncbi:MAG: cysteine--tRNA ligase, partial [Candidatus Omnitrophica bacterium]|nr:cysteine--tRNA ligase [Candidatus Omnitrophota bacterium]
GWHIECSVMSTNILGDQFDIHGGGLDLIFPHHENEIAQAEAATGGTFANYWIHNGLLTVNGEKMAKSLENYITVSSFLDKYKDPDILKLAFLNSHYRSPMDYTEDKMKSNVEAKDRIIGFVTRAEKFIGEKREHLLSKQALALRTDLDTRFKAAMDDDINTPLALAVIFDAVKMGNDIISDSKSPEEEKRNCLYVLMNFIWKCGEIFKLSLKVKKTNKEDEDKICILVKEREQARNDKDFKKADEIREKLLSGGVEILDTQEGTVWRKK